MTARSTLSFWLDGDAPQRPPIDPTSMFSGGRTLADLLRDRWRKLRAPYLERANFTCEVCGHVQTDAEKGTWAAMNVHEAWRYDLAARVQYLGRFWVLCWRCHQLAHARPTVGWPDAPSDGHELDAYRALADQATAEAEPRRLTVFAIDLRDPRGRERLPEAVVAAFERADHAGLPTRIRDILAYRIDEPLAAVLAVDAFAVRAEFALDPEGRRVEVAQLLADRVRALAEPEVLAALTEPPGFALLQKQTGRVGAWRQPRAPDALAPERRHVYGERPATWPQRPAWPQCAGCQRTPVPEDLPAQRRGHAKVWCRGCQAAREAYRGSQN